ncbi:hypothetical protein D3C72_2304540 [compost metagenome]
MLIPQITPHILQKAEDSPFVEYGRIGGNIYLQYFRKRQPGGGRHVIEVGNSSPDHGPRPAFRENIGFPERQPIPNPPRRKRQRENRDKNQYWP